MNRVLPILFNTEMVQAILREVNPKTATRRVIAELVKPEEWQYDGMTAEEYIAGTYRPRYRKGDILYVRETWGVMSTKRFDSCVEIAFKAGGENKRIFFPNSGTDSTNRDEYDEFIKKWDKTSTISWHPSIHMPQQAARIWLKVNNVYVQHIDDMTIDDFLKEGVVIRPEAFNDPENAYLQAKEEFHRIWESTLKGQDKECYMWDENPWIWAIEFERCEKPESW